MPRIESQVVYHDHIDGRGMALFDAIRGRDLEGVVAKWKHGGTTATARRRPG
jgi:ATP-dependent DNA ligase